MIPRATYRLQFNREFTFNDAARIVPYLARLGVSHLYASPILKARPGSMHGYDVTDHSQLNPELGERADFDRLVETLHAHDMGLIVDIVPNHLGVMGDENEWWLDMLENGPAARSASYFDVDWRPARASMRDRILVPVLGAPYGDVLERGELELTFERETGAFAVRYHEHLMPIDAREYPRIFADSPIPDALLPQEDPNRADFESLLSAFGNLPPRNDTSEEAITVRYRDKEAHKRRLVRLIERCAPILEHIEATLKVMNGEPGKSSSFDALDALLETQAYRLAYWRVAVDEINYRRFFDVNDLAALRMNDRKVFDSTHQFIFDLVDQGAVNGLRIDHSDGLYDPEGYFERLQQHFRGDSEEQKPLYVATEKILAAHERLPESWLVHGTTGYEFAALSTTWLVCGNEEGRTTRRYRQFTENPKSFDEIAYESKKLVMRASLAAEVEVLATQLDRIAQMDRHTADFTRAAMRDAIIEVIASFPVYRTYISPRGMSDEDRRIIHWAVGVARRRSASAELSVFDFLRDVLLAEAGGEHAAHRQAMLEFAMKFQQVTAPVTAKGVEDTSFYRYSRLVCLNEVGGDPARFAVSAGAMHQANVERAKSWPHSMLATSTHDTKRSEDARARIAVLSELPEEWKLHLSRWMRLNRSKRRVVEEAQAPSREDEYLIYQTLLGVWTQEPDFESLTSRVQAYMIKAAREAKRATSWISPNEEYEKALTDFVAHLLENPERNAFVKDFSTLAQKTAFFGRLNSLAVTALKLTAPGVPDFYQGTERTALALVDPDNRRPVDFEAAARQLEEVQRIESSPRALLEASDGSPAKLYVVQKLLNFRGSHADLFAHGGYQPLQVEGDRKDHVFAFARARDGEHCIVAVPRWTARLTGGSMDLPLGEIWSDTRINVGASSASLELLSNRKLEGEQTEGARWLRVAELFSEFPIAVLA